METIILNIETSSTVCSVALSKNNSTFLIKEENNGFTHSENLHVFIKNLLEEAKLSFTDLNAVSIGMGPGSYTGLRIGMSTAKGICYALNIPLIGVSTLQAMAAGVLADNNLSYKFLCPLIDARRMEVYYGVYDNNLNLLENEAAKIIDEASILDWKKYGELVFFGSGLNKCKQTLGSKLNANYLDSILPSANFMSQISYTKFLKKEFENLAYVEPNYAKEFYNTQKD